MLYKVTLITTKEEIIEADHDFDCDNKAKEMKEETGATKVDFRPLDREELRERNDVFNELSDILRP